MVASLKENILKLRYEGKKYKEISELLGCSKGTVSFHCTNNNLGGNYVSKIREKLTDKEIVELNKYYLNHTIEECILKFNVSKTTVVKHTKNKYVKLNDEELKLRNYHRLKTYRQRIKAKAVEYKGGCCQICEYDRSNSALEFHHIDPNEKDFGISSYTNLSWGKIKDELDKCILVCANCHREIHDEINNGV